MLPKIDPAAAAAANVGATQQQARRVEVDKVLEAYKASAATKVDERRVGNVGNEAREAARTAETTPGTQPVRTRTGSTDVLKRGEDQAEIAFQMTREEREVFTSYVSGEETIDQMSEAEKRMLERVAERLERLIAEADTRTETGRKRMDLALREWYQRLAGGKQSPEHLIDLIQMATQGRMDDKL
ncbi:MAG: hypothetical protein LUC93_06510 [Planctomycetaceae bacterium]|nr:hypothetical protein [Planctomycetaceae bacterium]